MEKKETRKPLIKVHKDDVRKHFRESSKTLESEIEKGFLRKKRPYRVLKGTTKGNEVSQILQQMRGKYLIGKAASKIGKEIDLTHIPKRDMYSACQLGWDGMLYNKQFVEKTLDKVVKAKKPNLSTYKELMGYLGNYIIGHKVITRYCNQFIDDSDISKAEEYYKGIKKQVDTIDDSIADKPRLYPHELNAIKRRHGVIPMFRKHQAPILYNKNGTPIKLLDLYDIDELIAEFESSNRGKNAIWRGAKTKAFKEWMQTRTGG